MNSIPNHIIKQIIHRMKRMEAVIFDMDGVLVDSEPHHIDIEKKLFKKLGLSVSEEEHAGYMGVATDAMWEKVNRNHQADLNIDKMVKMNYEECNNHFSSLEELEPMPGLVNVLNILQEQNIPIAVASSSGFETIKIILKRTGIINFFQVIVSGSMVEKSKPEPDIFLQAANLLNVEPHDCIVIEDSSNGVKAAKAAGMFCVSYSGAETSSPQPEADIRINHFAELERILKLFFDKK